MLLNGLLNKLNAIRHRAATLVFYKPQFRSLGAGTVVRTPLLLVNPHFMSLGRCVTIRDGARLEAIQTSPDRIPSLTIGDNTNIEQNVHIICHSRIQIGANVSITGNCSIVDVTHPYEDIYNPVKIGKRMREDDSHVEIGDGSFIGMGTVILPNVTLGKYVVVGANSVVTSDLPDYCVAAGAPARVIRRYDFAEESWKAEGKKVD